VTIDLEYIAARSVLLDAIGALGSQADSFILVGAQGVYAHTGNVAGTGSNRTTDADLALNTELLESDPELTSALEAAGFTATGQPGSWAGSRGIRVDIMTVPHQSNPKNHTSRSARLPPHGTNLARITAGLEAALIDNSKLSIEPLSTADPRSVEIAVAGPAALLVAKAIKISERNTSARAGKKDRAKTKDGVDCLRLLRTIETEDLISGFHSHCDGAEAEAVSHRALTYFSGQLRLGDDDEVRRAIRAELDDIVMVNSYTGLMEELLDGCRDSGLV